MNESRFGRQRGKGVGEISSTQTYATLLIAHSLGVPIGDLGVSLAGSVTSRQSHSWTEQRSGTQASPYQAGPDRLGKPGRSHWLERWSPEQPWK